MMLRYVKATLCIVVLFAGCLHGRAQSTGRVSYDVVFDHLPKPLPSIDETVTAYGVDATETALKKATNEISRQLTACYQPLSEMMAKTLEEVKLNRSALTRFSPEQQKLMEACRIGMKGLSQDAQTAYFSLLMQNRPLLSSGKLSWAPKVQALPATEAKLYQQLLSVEKSFDWTAFNKQASESYYSFADRNTELDVIHQTFDADFKKLPKRKLKIMEGAFIDIEDPDKAIALWKQYGAQTKKYFDATYAQSYLVWKSKYEALRRASGELDKLTEAAAASGLTAEKDRPFFIAMADLQARMGEALKSLSMSTQRLLNDALVGSIDKSRSEEMIAMYTKYKEENQ